MVELFLDARATLGESPRWSEAENCLYWVDIDARRIHRTNYATREDEFITMNEQVGCIALCRSGGLIMGLENGFAYMPRWGEAVEPFGEAFLKDKPHQRLNDAAVDPRGRFWAGTVTSDKSKADAALYRLDPNGHITKMLGGLLTSNGAAFSADERIFYHSDTPTHSIRRFAFDVDQGTISEGALFHQFEYDKGRPDGAALDEEGCYWTALFDGGKVVRFSPKGEILQSVDIPTSRPTMITLGGKDRKTAFVTSASKGLSEQQYKDQPNAGGIFTFEAEVPGQLGWKFAV